MSSDDAAIVHLHKDGGFTFTVWVGDGGSEEQGGTQKYATLRDAWNAASDIETEYGVALNPEVWEAEENRIRELVAQERRDHRKNMTLVKSRADKEREERQREIALRYMKEAEARSKANHPSNPNRKRDK